MKRTPKLFLEDIRASIEKAVRYVEGLSFDDFVNDEKTIDSVVRNLEIIGEASKNVPEEIRSKYSEIPWGDMIGMRNKIIHVYFVVEPAIVWKAVKEELPELKSKIEEVLKSL